MGPKITWESDPNTWHSCWLGFRTLDGDYLTATYLRTKYLPTYLITSRFCLETLKHWKLWVQVISKIIICWFKIQKLIKNSFFNAHHWEKDKLSQFRIPFLCSRLFCVQLKANIVWMKMPISGFESVASVSEATALSTVPQLLPTLVGARNSTEILFL